MGLVTLEMLTGEALPMGGDAWQALRHGVNISPPHGSCPQLLADAVTAMLNPNPQQRPTAFALVRGLDSLRYTF